MNFLKENKLLNNYLKSANQFDFGQVYKNLFIYMGEYIDVGIQSSILPLSIILSSIVLGIFALFGEETENDDDDSDSGSGGLMQPI